MVRRTNTNGSYYGATSFVPPPPPYPGFAQPSGPPYNDWCPADSPSSPPILESGVRILRNRVFLSTILTFIVTLGLCMTTMPVTYCNDPADPHVRERIREEWSKELLQHEKQVAKREVVKAQWAWEDERHARLVREWENERIDHEWELKERTRREEEERMRLNLSWVHVEAHVCRIYGRREYTAVLMNLPMNWGRRVAACRATPLEIHGIPYLPKSCEDKGTGGMIGLWEITQQEPECTPFWDSHHDKGCTSPGSGKRHITHKLENIPQHSDWQELCATTPARFDHMEFPGAPECIESIWGIYGQWEIEDGSC